MFYYDRNKKDEIIQAVDFYKRACASGNKDAALELIAALDALIAKCESDRNYFYNQSNRDAEDMDNQVAKHAQMHMAAGANVHSAYDAAERITANTRQMHDDRQKRYCKTIQELGEEIEQAKKLRKETVDNVNADAYKKL